MSGSSLYVAVVFLLGPGLPLMEAEQGPRFMFCGMMEQLRVDPDIFDNLLDKVDPQNPSTVGDVLEAIGPGLPMHEKEEKRLRGRLGGQAREVMMKLLEDPRLEVRWYVVDNLTKYVTNREQLRKIYRDHLTQFRDYQNAALAIKLRELGDNSRVVIEAIAANGGSHSAWQREDGIASFSEAEFLMVVESLLDPRQSDNYKANAAWALRGAPLQGKTRQTLIERFLSDWDKQDNSIREWSAIGLAWLRYYDARVEQQLLAQSNNNDRLREQIIPMILTWKPRDPRRLEPFVDAILNNWEPRLYRDDVGEFDDLLISIFHPDTLFRGASLTREQKDRLIPYIRNSDTHEETVTLIRASEIEDPVLEKVIAGYPENMEPKKSRPIIHFQRDPADDPFDPFGDPEDPFAD